MLYQSTKNISFNIFNRSSGTDTSTPIPTSTSTPTPTTTNNIILTSMHLLLLGVEETFVHKVASTLSKDSGYYPVELTESNIYLEFQKAQLDSHPRIFYTSSGHLLTSEPLTSLLPNPMILTIYIDIPSRNLPSAQTSSLRQQFDILSKSHPSNNSNDNHGNHDNNSRALLYDISQEKLATFEKLRNYSRNYNDSTWPTSSPHSVTHVDARIFEDIYDYRLTIDKDMTADEICNLIAMRLSRYEPLISTRGSPNHYDNVKAIQNKNTDKAIPLPKAILNAVNTQDNGGLFLFDGVNGPILSPWLIESMKDLTYEQRLQRVFEALPTGTLRPSDIADAISKVSFLLQNPDMASVVTVNGTPLRRLAYEKQNKYSIVGIDTTPSDKVEVGRENKNKKKLDSTDVNDADDAEDDLLPASRSKYNDVKQKKNILHQRTYLLESFRGLFGSSTDIINPMMGVLFEKTVAPSSIVSEYVADTMQTNENREKSDNLPQPKYGVVVSGSPHEVSSFLLTHDLEKSPVVAIIPLETIQPVSDMILQNTLLNLSSKAVNNVRVYYTTQDEGTCERIVKSILLKNSTENKSNQSQGSSSSQLPHLQHPQYPLVSPNSGVNIASLIPIISYYVSAYVDFLKHGVLKTAEETTEMAMDMNNTTHTIHHTHFDVAMPCDNLSYAVAAIIAQRIGVPIRHMIVGTTSSNHRALQTAVTNGILTNPTKLHTINHNMNDTTISTTSLNLYEPVQYDFSSKNSLPMNYERILHFAFNDYMDQTQAGLQHQIENGAFGPVDTIDELKYQEIIQKNTQYTKISEWMSQLGIVFDIPETGTSSVVKSMNILPEMVATLPYGPSFIPVTRNKIRQTALQMFIQHSRIADMKTATALTAAQEFYDRFYPHTVQDATSTTSPDAVPLLVVGAEHPELSLENSLPGLYLTTSSSDQFMKTYEDIVTQMKNQHSVNDITKPVADILRQYDRKVKTLSNHVLKKKRNEMGEVYISLTPKNHENIRNIMTEQAFNGFQQIILADGDSKDSSNKHDNSVDNGERVTIDSLRSILEGEHRKIYYDVQSMYNDIHTFLSSYNKD